MKSRVPCDIGELSLPDFFDLTSTRYILLGLNYFVFSWNIGPVHIISFSTELYYYLKYGIEPLIQQYKWLEKDLEVMNAFFFINRPSGEDTLGSTWGLGRGSLPRGRSVGEERVTSPKNVCVGG